MLLSVATAAAAEPDWSRGFVVPEDGRANPYSYSAEELEPHLLRGKGHALEYPVEVTGLLVPRKPLENLIEAPTSNPLKQLLRKFIGGLTGVQTMDELFEWVGLHPFPRPDDSGVYSVPYPGGKRPEGRMGVAYRVRGGAEGFTIGCMGCHSANLFGKTVLGMTNRFPRANAFFDRGRQGTELTSEASFQHFTGATDAETRLFAQLKENSRSIGTRRPQQLGLDTSLAQVALSLARRGQDPYATKSAWNQAFPRPDPLESFVADSKPAVWWNLKYKNRWLCDGSVVSGNPIYTNLLWNEIGRGADLRELGQWLDANPEIVADLTTAVFSSEAPRFTDFFPADRLQPAEVRRGQALFENRCARCHGHYEKAWDLPEAQTVPWVDQLRTTHVRYPQTTPVRDVGTDPNRAAGMKSLEQLNRLALSQAHGIVIETQKGYVPPPLVGIWARWPYLHNNSVPSLCALLTPAAARPREYWAREANDPERDFDSDCNGYPAGEGKGSRYDATREGMTNRGHDVGIFVGPDGRELLTWDEKRSLIRFLQTL
jgi:hypothetical protein